MQTVNRDRLTFAAAADSAVLAFGHKQVLAKWRRDVRPALRAGPAVKAFGFDQ